MSKETKDTLDKGMTMGSEEIQRREVKALEQISESLKSIELTLKRREFLKK